MWQIYPKKQPHYQKRKRKWRGRITKPQMGINVMERHSVGVILTIHRYLQMCNTNRSPTTQSRFVVWFRFTSTECWLLVTQCEENKLWPKWDKAESLFVLYVKHKTYMCVNRLRSFRRCVIWLVIFQVVLQKFLWCFCPDIDDFIVLSSSCRGHPFDVQ